jgi:uncharacterized protein (TIGR02687 family)
MTEPRMTQALSRLFEKHRIVFWYDSKQELHQDFEDLDLPEIEKREIANNEFGLKHEILRALPDQKFLLYHFGPQPADLDNWLLDVLLAHNEFRTDQAAIWLAELELGLEFSELTRQHADFFTASKRRETLKRLLKSDDTAGLLRLKMLAVCAHCEARLDVILAHLLQELADQKDEKIKLIGRCALDSTLWEQLKKHFGYESSKPSLTDFVIQIFKYAYESNFSLPTSHSSLATGHSPLLTDSLVFLKRWKDSRQFEASFETLSAQCADVLGIEQDLNKRDFRDLIELDDFSLIDQKIISDLALAISERTVSPQDVTLWIRNRRQSHWYDQYRHYYEALEQAAEFVRVLAEAQFSMDNLADGIQRYTRSWYLLDQLYRKYIYHTRMAGAAAFMTRLNAQIENLYTNNYLLKLNDHFQSFVDQAHEWQVSPLPKQNQFFERRVRPFLKKEHKVCVIISDALRYEIGEELLRLIRQEDRYSAELEAAVSMLPSYTQLGMAALLPHKALAFADNESGSVLVDGQSSQGTANRSKILATALEGRATASTYEEFMSLNRDEARDLLKAHDVLYVYHNRIDHTGDKIHSEGQAFEAAAQTLDDLVKGVKKLTAANANNILITADHGFIYQHRPLEDSDFLSTEARGKKIHYKDRRFVLGKGLVSDQGLKHFSAEQLGLTGEVEVLIPKSINRLRLKGSGSRFVHGGASLQEVVIPVLKINKKRQSDVSSVEVEILRGASQVISAAQCAVVLYQIEPVTEKVQARMLRAAIYTESGELISDSHELTFDFSAEHPRQRELPVRFMLTRRADDANGQEVILKLEEQHSGTSHYKEYKSLRYTLRRSFTRDFDF